MEHPMNTEWQLFITDHPYTHPANFLTEKGWSLVKILSSIALYDDIYERSGDYVGVRYKDGMNFSAEEHDVEFYEVSKENV